MNRLMNPELRKGLTKEAWEQCKLAPGYVTTATCQFLMQPLAIMFAGRLSKNELDAVALGSSLINIFGNAVAEGAGFACDTVFSQTYGSSNKKNLGVQLQKGGIIYILMYIICLSILLNIGPVLIAMKVDPVVVSLTVTYLETFIPGLLVLFFTVLIRKFVQVQNETVGQIVVGLVGLAAQALFQYIFVVHLQYGIKGSTIAQTLAYLVLFFGFLLYTKLSGLAKETWSGFDLRCLLNWSQYIKITVASVFMMLLEYILFEATIFLAGARGVTELAIQSVLLNGLLGFLGCATGFSLSASIRCGQFLGAGEPQNAKKSFLVGFILIVILSALLTIIYGSLKYYTPMIYTDLPEVLEGVRAIGSFFAGYIFFDIVSTSGRHVMAGVGRQNIGLGSSVVGYYAIGFPIGLTLWFKTDLSLEGLWIGFLIAVNIANIIIYSYLFFIVDWEVLSNEAVVLASDGMKTQENDTEEPKTEGTPLVDSSDFENTVTTSLVLKRIITIVAFLTLLGVAVLIKVFDTDIQKSKL